MKIIKKALTLGVIFIFLSCEKDLYDEYINSDKHSILVQRKNFEDLKKNKKLMKSIEKFTSKSTYTLQKQHYDSINNFYIDLDNVMFTLDSLNHQTYTFKINRIPNNYLFENLILKTSKTGGFDAILAQYNQNALNLSSTIQGEIQNSINQNITFTYLGKKSLSEINSKFSYNEECFEPGYVYSSGQKCASGQHTFADGANCDYWGTTNMATTGGYVYTMMPVSCPGGGGSGISSIGFSTGPHGGGSGSVLTPPTPCTKLKELFNTSKANIKPIIQNLQSTISATSGENGEELFHYSNGGYANSSLNQSTDALIYITAGGNRYSAIHTHPLTAQPMFSWSDIVTLNALNNYSLPHNADLASFLLVCQDDNGVFQTYAAVFDPNSFNETIDQFIGNPENNGCSSQEIETKMNDLLDEEYVKDSNYERAFLKFMSSSNVSLYKANSTLTNWSKLSLSNNSATATVNSTNCN
ncbi:hypothetical protein [Flavobacterium facile]|uniref:hypothetical protein n=1 Tax=Flavobacterium facile TaxID=2893174 RepID=UPI002E7959FA|nr:hypothetical protein [Flavobacterium sp. T-12]